MDRDPRLGDSAVTFDLLAADATGMGQTQIADAYLARAKEARDHAEVARVFMLDLTRRLDPRL